MHASRWGLRRSVGPAEEGCPRYRKNLLNVSTGELFAASCKSIRCEACSEREVRRRAARIARAGPERFLTLTALPDAYQDARRAEQRFLEFLRRRGYRIEWAAVHERTKAGARHGHYLTRGDFIPQRLMSDAAARAGMGSVVWVNRIRNNGAAGYALKGALRTVAYATKGREHLDEHLDMNGGRLCRTTRGYFKP